MFKAWLRLLYYIFYGLRYLVYIPLKYSLLLLWWTCRLIWRLVRANKSGHPDNKKHAASDVSLDIEEEAPYDPIEIASPPVQEEKNIESGPLEEEDFEAVSKIGSVVPVEEDHALRTFTIMNPEGEIYRINTALPGPFYGPVWTKILDCYETRKTLRGRLSRPLYNQAGRHTGFQIRIGQVRAFLPNPYSMRWGADQKSLNIRIAIENIDPDRRKVTVNAKAAYEIMFERKPLPVSGEEAEGLFWDYDQKYLYLLCPVSI